MGLWPWVTGRVSAGMSFRPTCASSKMATMRVFVYYFNCFSRRLYGAPGTNGVGIEIDAFEFFRQSSLEVGQLRLLLLALGTQESMEK